MYRKDMSHGFRYGGRYPLTGKNKDFGPEMAVKVSEVMALRRAFNVAMPTLEERWDVEVPAVEPEPSKSLAEKAAEKAAAIANEQPATPDRDQANAELPIPESAPHMVQCESLSPFTEEGQEPVQCRREAGHVGAHRTENESWPA